MPSSKEIRNRIATVVSTQKITYAMKMVAAARLRRAQEAILQLRPYATKLNEILNSIASSVEEKEENVFTEQRALGKVLIVVVTSNRGFCGAFNANVIRRAVSVAYDEYGELLQQDKLNFMALGKKGYDFLRRKKFPLYDHDNQVVDKPSFQGATVMAQRLTELYLSKEYDRIVFIYNQFKNAAVQILKVEQYLPVEVSQKTEVKIKGKFHQLNFLFEPNKVDIVRELIPKSLRVQVFKMLSDSYASEQGARMTAMHLATDNASDLLRDLRRNYNKTRQAAITKEILEIVGGAEALSK
jgi:F-type H+-transporting ATPase subunit gamma